MSPRLDQMPMRDLEDAGQRFLEAKGRMNGEDGSELELDDHEVQCWDYLGYEGVIDPECRTCSGTGRMDAIDSPDWCSRCGMTGRCPDCDPDTYRDAALDR